MRCELASAQYSNSERDVKLTQSPTVSDRDGAGHGNGAAICTCRSGPADPGSAGIAL